MPLAPYRIIIIGDHRCSRCVLFCNRIKHSTVLGLVISPSPFLFSPGFLATAFDVTIPDPLQQTNLSHAATTSGVATAAHEEETIRRYGEINHLQRSR